MSDTNTKPLFRPFSWVWAKTPSRTEMLISHTMDIAFGLETILQMLERDELAADSEGQPILGIHDKERLRRLGIASARLLGECAEEEIERINKEA